jgi:hypothetical protein
VVEITRAPSAIAVTVAFLKEQFTAHGETAAVGSKIRDPRPSKFVRVRLMGGFRPDIARVAPMVVFECWANDDVAAESLGILTEALVNAMPDLLPICTRVVEVGGLGEQSDPESGSPRYVFTKQLYLRSTVLV